MTITLGLNLLSWRIGCLDIRVDIDPPPETAAAPPKVMDAVSDYFANRWFRRHS